MWPYWCITFADAITIADKLLNVTHTYTSDVSNIDIKS